MKAWFSGLSLLWKLIIGLLAVAFIFFAYNFVDDWFSKDDEVRAELSENQTEAAIESGVDTVNTVTNQYTRETERIETIREVQKEVNNATTIHDAHVAGARGLCDNFGICSEDVVQPANP